MSKPKQFIRDFLNEEGKSELINRYSLPEYCAYTSGDGIFRNDGWLGRNTNSVVSPEVQSRPKTNRAWDLTDEQGNVIRRAVK